MRKRTAVVMFCGPLLESGNVETLRISAAIKCALDEHAPLVIVGDAERRFEMELYESMAHEHGVILVTRVFASSMMSSSYACALAMHLKEHHAQLTEVYLVTDHWHMTCAQVMLAYFLKEERMPVTITRMDVKSAIETLRHIREAAHAELAIFAKDKVGVELIFAQA